MLSFPGSTYEGMSRLQTTLGAIREAEAHIASVLCAAISPVPLSAVDSAVHRMQVFIGQLWR